MCVCVFGKMAKNRRVAEIALFIRTHFHSLAARHRVNLGKFPASSAARENVTFTGEVKVFAGF